MWPRPEQRRDLEACSPSALYKACAGQQGRWRWQPTITDTGCADKVGLNHKASPRKPHHDFQAPRPPPCRWHTSGGHAPRAPKARNRVIKRVLHASAFVFTILTSQGKCTARVFRNGGGLRAPKTGNNNEQHAPTRTQENHKSNATEDVEDMSNPSRALQGCVKCRSSESPQAAASSASHLQYAMLCQATTLRM